MTVSRTFSLRFYIVYYIKIIIEVQYVTGYGRFPSIR